MPGQNGTWSLSPGEDESLSKRLALARLFIRKAYGKIDPDLPGLLDVLEDVGAAECWHKHGTFYEHLHNVYRNLKMWDVADSVARCGLYHSSYSNSYVNLAIFEPDAGRQKVREVIGRVAEELVHWFCIVPRQALIFDLLLSKYSDEELVLHGGRGDDGADGGAGHRRRVAVPAEGLWVKHIRSGEDLLVPRRLIAVFLILTIADFSDQWYGWQDSMFGNADGNMGFSADDGAAALWPGDGKPGLWMTAISRMALLLKWILKDEEEYNNNELSRSHHEGKEQQEVKGERPFSNVELKVLPILDNCSVFVSPADQVRALNLYWKAVSAREKDQILGGSASAALKEAIKHNPYIAEPHIVLAQILLHGGNWEEGEQEALKGLNLLLEWGTHWDKRMTWEGWISWARVLHMNAKEKTWPQTGWGILNLGLVK